MSQNPISPADGDGATYQANVNNAFDTVVSLSAGAGAPSELVDQRFWADTSNNLLKQYDNVAAAWVTMGWLRSPFFGMIQPLANNNRQTAVENLYVTRPTTTTLLVTADDCMVRDTASPVRAWRTGALNVTINSAVNGAAGLDTGTLTSGNHYHIWAIYNPTTNTKSAILSLAYPGSGAVTMPAGYTAKGYLCPAGLVSAGPVLSAQYCVGNLVTMSGGVITLTGASGGVVALGASQLNGVGIPPNAKLIGGNLGVLTTSGTSAVSFILYESTAAQIDHARLTVPSVNTSTFRVPFSCPLFNQDLQYNLTGTNPQGVIRTTWYQF